MDSIVADTLQILVDTVFVHDTITTLPLEAVTSAVSTGSHDNIIPFIVALISFFLGVTADAILRNSAKKRSLMSIKSTIVFWYKKEHVLVEQTIQSISDMAKRISVSDLFQPEGTKIHNIDLSRLCDFRLDELINAFVENVKGEEESERFSYLYHFQKESRYIDLSVAEIRSKHEQYVADIRNLMDEWNSAYKQLSVEIDKYPGYALRNKWQQLYRDCQSQGGGIGDHINFEKWDSSVIEPFIKYCESDAKEFNPFAILLKLDDLRTIVIKLRANREYSRLFSDYAMLMGKALESLDKSVAYIESAKIKFWVH